MISFQSPLSPPDMIRNTIPEFENSSKKRKLEDSQNDHEKTSDKRSKPESMKSMFNMELQLETPLPLEWQRCLDIQSGQIHFYNTKTHTRTCKDPRISPEPPSPGHMSLDLELNLPCDSSVRKANTTDHRLINKQNSVSPTRAGSVDKKTNSSGGLTRNLSWLAVEDDQQEQEMVATVCMRCHILVMLCKSSPSCPNCKFTHPPDQGPPKLFKQRLSLLC
ncbi:putative LRR receptor-like serine/threonine-protein kinase [Hibiscus syriacus]|uniref:LRR receptor-like serine/threonine-protein kinase n=1 Tax=Hibiscus syriacus TaxID=106335 RepID=A0A6A2Y7C9_HIBSY|nr:uncharacterized protein LOC120180151 [Hibiscus syriacus]XP_039041468.1 uncharacterized protein LOC120180151 [Hibiscus syriacus]KAE8666807.1 putative LRR receptor-like serine/threonine-protein kinase [Hibiscus syriacus]